MSKNEIVAQAFPTAIAVDPTGDVYTGNDGMDLRDYFAAKALSGVIQDRYFLKKSENMGYLEFASEIAEQVYAISDAMLAERSK